MSEEPTSPAAQPGAVVVDTLPLTEVFGPTWQGEGPHAGRLCSFVRLGWCNLRCEWCDQPETWDRARYNLAATSPETPAHEILTTVLSHGTELLILTGGEPLIWQTRTGLRDLLDGWPGRVHVETNGTVRPRTWLTERVEHFSVGLKLTTRDPVQRRIKPHVISEFRALAVAGRACFKFVVADGVDVRQVATFAAEHELPHDMVWVMPLGTDAVDVIARHRQIAATALTLGMNTTSRLHTLLWDNERGR